MLKSKTTTENTNKVKKIFYTFFLLHNNNRNKEL